MRPQRVEVEGFTAFRAPTVIDFEGADLFALTGPTGSGKTSVLDAIVFALYGSVPRLADQRAVAPVIAQGMAEARVRLDFTIDGEAYTATRVVRATKAGGGTTSEARLERVRDNAVLAGTADEATAAATALLGLTYEHFTKCVLLPQGEFARFLHDKPKDRQDLLVTLLELDVYGRMAARAGQRAAKAANDASVLDGRMADLEAATPEAIGAASERVELLTALVAEVDAALPELAALEAHAVAARAQGAEDADAASRLAAVVLPAGLEQLDEQMAAARAAMDDAVALVAAAEASVRAAEDALASLPDRADLTRAKDGHARALGLRERLTKGRSLHDERQQDVAAAEKVLLDAEERVARALLDEDAAVAAHRAHAVRGDLMVGEPCPVCLQTVTTVPDDVAPPLLAAAKQERELAEGVRRHAADAVGVARNELTKIDAQLTHLTDELTQLEAELSALPPIDAVETQLAAVAAATELLASERDRLTSVRKDHAEAVAVAERTAAAEAAARSQFDETRDAVASLGPPVRLGADASLTEQWESLVRWAGQEAVRRQRDAQRAAERVAEAEGAHAALVAALVERCAAARLDSHGEEQPWRVAQVALGKATAELDHLVVMAEDRARLLVEREHVQERRDVARGLATHLDARHFEKWVLDEAMAGLADGATELLKTLSGGQYSLRIDKKSAGFVVIDHRNADAPRSARTLSGGETFLASLALALALADRIADMAARGTARLESIFLDEGFGTLDPDTLDVVAAAIEELGAAGRMVGIVSHVSDLAERLPVRYEVRRLANASTVERVDR